MGYLRGGDGITMNRDSVVYAAKQVARALADVGWQPPVPATVAVQGRDGLANFHKLLHIVRGGDFVSDHDLFLSDAVAFVLCGGDVDPGTVVDEQYLLDLERHACPEGLPHSQDHGAADAHADHGQAAAQLAAATVPKEWTDERSGDRLCRAHPGRQGAQGVAQDGAAGDPRGDGHQGGARAGARPGPGRDRRHHLGLRLPRGGAGSQRGPATSACWPGCRRACPA